MKLSHWYVVGNNWIHHKGASTLVAEKIHSCCVVTAIVFATRNMLYVASALGIVCCPDNGVVCCLVDEGVLVSLNDIKVLVHALKVWYMCGCESMLFKLYC